MTVKDILSKLTIDNLSGIKVVLYDLNKYLPDGMEYDPKYFKFEVPMTLRGDWRLIPTKYTEHADRKIHSILVIGKTITIYMW